MDVEKLLEPMPLFQGLSADEVTRVSGRLHRRLIPANTLLIMADDPGHAAYLIVSGTVKIFLSLEDGSEAILALCGPGEIIGEMSLFDSGRRAANAVTRDDSVVLSWDHDSFEECLRTIPALSHNLLRIMARRLRRADGQIRALATLDLPGRLAYQILVFADIYGCPTDDGVGTLIPLHLTQTDLAGLVGATRVRVNEVMMDFRRRSYIAVNERHCITVLDRDALARRSR